MERKDAYTTRPTLHCTVWCIEQIRGVYLQQQQPATCILFCCLRRCLRCRCYGCDRSSGSCCCCFCCFLILFFMLVFCCLLPLPLPPLFYFFCCCRAIHRCIITLPSRSCVPHTRYQGCTMYINTRYEYVSCGREPYSSQRFGLVRARQAATERTKDTKLQTKRPYRGSKKIQTSDKRSSTMLRAVSYICVLLIGQQHTKNRAR